MSVHVEDGRLLAYVDRELGAGERAELEAHLNTCIACRHALARVRNRAQVVSGALALVDHPSHSAATAAGWAAVQEALGPRREAAAPARPGRRQSRRLGWEPGRWGLARAAGLVLLAAASAAAAVVPGSPVRSLIFGERSSATADLELPVEAVAPAAASGSWTRAVDGQVSLALSAPTGTPVEVVWEGSRAGLLGPADTRYASREDGVLEAEASGGLVRVEIPGDIRDATLRVNGQPVLSIRQGQVTLTPPDAVGTLRMGGEPLHFQVR